MFPSSANSGHNSSTFGGAVLIPTRFVWPYGGTRVLLSGSFTGWSEHILMSPMEGCPTVFQVICNLTPGPHQYKFIVDGEWRHDDHQPFVSGSYGIVNTIFLSREPDMVSVPCNPDVPGRSNMDVDDSTFLRMATLSDSILHDAVPRVSEADIEVSRSRISLFLSQHTAYELLPESGKVVALDVNLPVKQAFHILYEQGTPIAPLWDFNRGQFVGVLSAIDFILILRELGTLGSNLTEEELESHTISAWKDGKSRMNRQVGGNGRLNQSGFVHAPLGAYIYTVTAATVNEMKKIQKLPFTAHLSLSSTSHKAGPYDSLKDVAIKILQTKVSTVPVIHSSSPDGSFPQLLHLASLSGILKCICRHFKHSSSSLPILQQPVCSVPLGTWVPKIGESTRRPMAMLRQHASLGDALSLLVQDDVSSVPIVDDNHSLIDIYSRSDITSLAKDRAYAYVQLNEMSIHQALQLEQDASSSHGASRAQRCQMCLPSDPLQKVMERLANPGVRRLVIVEAGSKRVEGIITLSDIFRFLLG